MHCTAFRSPYVTCALDRGSSQARTGIKENKIMSEASVAPSGAPLTMVQGELIAQRSARVLLGWLPEQDAIRQLLGRNPTPQDELTAISQAITSAHAAVQRRPATTISDPVIERDRSFLYEVAARPEVRAGVPAVPRGAPS